MIHLHALNADRERLEPVDERNAEMQSGSGNRAELAEAFDNGALILTHGEKRRHKIESKQRDQDGEAGGDAEQAFRKSAAGSGLLGNGDVAIGPLLKSCESSRRQPLRPAELSCAIAVICWWSGQASGRPDCRLSQTCTASGPAGHCRSHASEARFFPAFASPYIRQPTGLGTPPGLQTFHRAARTEGGGLEVTAMRTHALRIVVLAAILAHLTGVLATEASAEAAGRRTASTAGASWTSSLRSEGAPISPRSTSYRPDAVDTGPPTPGPTDPNGPST